MFIVLEVQTNTDGTIGTLITTHEDRNEAESKYHAVLSAGAISKLPLHTAYILTADGQLINSECYRHEVTE